MGCKKLKILINRYVGGIPSCVCVETVRCFQELQNKLARVSCEACSCLAGLKSPYPLNDAVFNSLSAMLTGYVCYLLQITPADQVKKRKFKFSKLFKLALVFLKTLKLLNSNCETPYLIWDNSTRAELLEFVEKHRNSTLQTVNLNVF